MKNKLNITENMLKAATIAVSQWRNGKKYPAPTYIQLAKEEKEAYGDQALSCLVAAGKEIKTLQDEVNTWVIKCFSEEKLMDKSERIYRFLEEAIELAQASGMSKDECVNMVSYVYARPQGEQNQEVGGVLTTLAAYCTANNIDMEDAGRQEVIRVNGKIDEIREKQKGKLKPC